MKIEITNDFLKQLTRALKREVAPGFYCYISDISVNFLDGVFYTLDVNWGSDEHKVYHTSELCFDEKDTIEFIRGRFAESVYRMECEE